MRFAAMLAKELRGRMRSWRSLVIITIYVGTLAAIGIGTISDIQSRQQNTGLDAAKVGPQVFGALAEFQIILLAFVTPALTADAIAGEKERQTYELLLTTRLSSLSIILGKLLTSLAYVFVLLILSLPLFSLAYLFGGVNLGQLAITFLILAVAALAIGSLSMLVSTVVRKVQIATATAYVLTFALILGTGIFAYLVTNKPANSLTIAPFSEPPPPSVLAYFSPIAAVSTVVSTPFGSAVQIPFLPLPSGLPDYYFNYSAYDSLAVGRGDIGYGYTPNFYSLPTVWPWYLLIYAGIIVVCVGLSVLLVRPRRFLQWRRKPKIAKIEAQG